MGFFLVSLTFMDLQFAIVGCGNIAPRHAAQIVRHGKLVAVCDILPERAKALAQTYSCREYTSFDEMLEKEPTVNVVVVATPNGLHAEHTIKSLQQGRHVLCEKPMCLCSPAGWSMRDTAHFFRKQLFVVKQNRFNPPVQVVKKWLEEGKLGKIVAVQVNGFWNRPASYYQHSWKGSLDMDGGILFTQFSHFIDLLTWYFGDIKEVHSHRKNQLLEGLIETEDNIVCAGEMENGALFTLHFSVSSYQQNMEGSMTILGEKGAVKIGGQYLNTLEYKIGNGLEGEVETASRSANDYGTYVGSMSNHDLVYDQVVARLNGQTGLYTGAEDGLRTVAAIEKIYRSCNPTTQVS